MNRRSFLKTLAALAVAPLLPDPKLAPVGEIRAWQGFDLAVRDQSHRENQGSDFCF